MNFVAWLHGQALSDAEREMPYARLYEIGPLIEAAIGDSDFDLVKLTTAVRSHYSDPFEQMEYCEALVAAESVWRIDRVTHSTEELVATTAVDVVEYADYKCGYRSLRGVACPKPALLGMARCEDHGGAITDPEVRRSILLTAYAKTLEGMDTAVEALVDIAAGSRNDIARVYAAREILDRAGLVQDQHIHLHAGDDGSDREEVVVELLRQRLDEVRDRLIALPSVPTAPPAPAEPASKDSDDEVIDAEIVDD